MRKNITLLLFIFLFVKGLLFVVLIPPWQGPDEPTHFEYMEKFLYDFKEDGSSKKISLMIDDSLKKDYLKLRGKKYWSISSVQEYKIQRDIIESMQKFDFWRFTEKPPLYSHVEVLGQHSYISTISHGTDPLYFWVLSKVVGIFKTTSLLGTLYVARIFSMLLGLLTIFFIFLIAKEITWGCRDDLFVLSAAAFAGLLPQFSFLSATVNSGNMVILICSAITYVLILLTRGNEINSINYPRSLKFYVQLLIIIALIFAGLLTKRSALVIIPVVMFSFFLYGASARNVYGRVLYQGRIAFFFLVSMVLITIVLYVFDKSLITSMYSRLSPAHTSIVNFFNSLTDISPAVYLRTLLILFVSFCFSFGWMVYKMSIGWYILFGAITLLCLVGLGKFLFFAITRREEVINKFNMKGLAILSLLIVFTLFAVVVFRGPAYMEGTMIQGRFIFIAFPSIAIFFALGFNYTPAKFSKENTLKIFILFMLVLNGISIFKYLIPLFYLS